MMRRAGIFIRTLEGFLGGINGDDVILSSFPRTGSTWLRFILCNVISLQEWNGRAVDFNLLNKTMVELGVSHLHEKWSYHSLPRIVKTHKNSMWMLRGHSAIGMIRDPRDVMVSFFHYKKDRQQDYQKPFSTFIRDRRFGLPAWFSHYVSWRSHWSYVIQYEKLKMDPVGEMSLLLEYLKNPIDREILREAVARSSIERIRAVDNVADDRNSQAMFARRGTSGQWQSIFSEDDLSYYKQLATKFELADYEFNQ